MYELVSVSMVSAHPAKAKHFPAVSNLVLIHKIIDGARKENSKANRPCIKPTSNKTKVKQPRNGLRQQLVL